MHGKHPVRDIRHHPGIAMTLNLVSKIVSNIPINILTTSQEKSIFHPIHQHRLLTFFKKYVFCF
jgi:hypothetical protein